MTEDQELNRLINQLINGSIIEEDFSRLQNVLLHDSDARQLYYDLLGLDILLAEHYEVPDYIAVHSQTIDNSWALRRAKRGMLTWSLAGAAAILMITLGSLFLFKAAPHEITIAASEDSHFKINGEVPSDVLLKADDMLKLDHGVVSLALGPYVEACVDGPARLRLLNEQGHIELLSGNAFFQISPGGHDFEVHTRVGIIRDIGTKFGVKVQSGGKVEVHVTDGAVEIDREGSEIPYRVDANHAVKWTRKGHINKTTINLNLFVQSLPLDQTLLRDDFSEEDGTLISGKIPDSGFPWRVLAEATETEIMDGKLDTSYGPRTVSARFMNEQSVGRRRVYITTLKTAQPENYGDKSHQSDAAENITLWNSNGTSIVSLSARASDSHLWRLTDSSHRRESDDIGLSALEKNTLTLTYERDTGIVRLFEGADTRGPLLQKMKVNSGETPVSLTISNEEGGDLSLDEVQVKVVAYPQNSSLED